MGSGSGAAVRDESGRCVTVARRPIAQASLNLVLLYGGAKQPLAAPGVVVPGRRGVGRT